MRGRVALMLALGLLIPAGCDRNEVQKVPPQTVCPEGFTPIGPGECGDAYTECIRRVMGAMAPDQVKKRRVKVGGAVAAKANGTVDISTYDTSKLPETLRVSIVERCGQRASASEVERQPHEGRAAQPREAPPVTPPVVQAPAQPREAPPVTPPVAQAPAAWPRPDPVAALDGLMNAVAADPFITTIYGHPETQRNVDALREWENRYLPPAYHDPSLKGMQDMINRVNKQRVSPTQQR